MIILSKQEHSVINSNFVYQYFVYDRSENQEDEEDANSTGWALVCRVNGEDATTLFRLGVYNDEEEAYVALLKVMVALIEEKKVFLIE